MMTLVGLGMLVIFGFLAVRHFRNGRIVWAILAGFGSILGAASLWVDYQRATMEGDEASRPAQNDPSEQEGPVIDDYDPNANYEN